MSNVFCIRYQKNMPALAKPPFPGKDGDYVYNNLSSQAWSIWLEEQTRLVNEQQLNPLEADTRTFLRQQLFRYINNQPFETASGHITRS